MFEAFVRARPYRGTCAVKGSRPALRPRERAVLVGLAAGRTRNAIAVSERLSQRTVARILDDLEAKMGASSACELVAKAAALGLLAESTTAGDGENDRTPAGSCHGAARSRHSAGTKWRLSPLVPRRKLEGYSGSR